MFSGLTNQVSTWIGKKGEDESVLPEEKVGSPGAGGDLDAEKKDNRYSFHLLNFRKFCNFQVCLQLKSMTFHNFYMSNLLPSILEQLKTNIILNSKLIINL